MKLAPNQFKQRLRTASDPTGSTGSKQIGIWLSLSSGYGAGVVSGSDYDWFLVDMEHAPNSLATVIEQLQVLGRRRGTAMVRVPWNDHVVVKQLLDGGARALLFPMVQTVAEAEKAVEAVRYPPRGIRGVAGSVRANEFGRITDYFERVEGETAIVVRERRQFARIRSRCGTVHRSIGRGRSSTTMS